MEGGQWRGGGMDGGRAVELRFTNLARCTADIPGCRLLVIGLVFVSADDAASCSHFALAPFTFPTLPTTVLEDVCAAIKKCRRIVVSI